MKTRAELRRKADPVYVASTHAHMRGNRSLTQCIAYNPRIYPEFPPFEALFPDLSRHLRTAYRRTEIIPRVGSGRHALLRQATPKP